MAEGQSLDLNCVVAGQGQATVTWYKRGGSLPAKHQVGDTRGGCHQGRWLGLTRSPVQAWVAPCKRNRHFRKLEWSRASPGAPIQAQMAPCKPQQPHGSPNGPRVPSPQVSGSRLRLLQVTAADSGEYVCRVTSGATTKETAVMVTIQPSGASAYSEWGPEGTRDITREWVTLPCGVPGSGVTRSLGKPPTCVPILAPWAPGVPWRVTCGGGHRL